MIVRSWSPSRYDAYKTCPLKFKLEKIDSLCPICHEGRVLGWAEKAQCDACHGKPTVPDPIARGNVIHKMIEDFIVIGKPFGDVLSGVRKIITDLRKAREKNTQVVRVEHDFVFQPNWIPVSKYTKGAWLRAKADVLHIKAKVVEVIDWKSGGIDKKTKEIRAQEKYDDTLEIYGMATLCVFPTHDEAKPSLVFVDGPPKRNVVDRAPVKRRDLVKLQKKWDKKIEPMFNDTTFAPRANAMCGYCDYRKGAGGPCPY